MTSSEKRRARRDGQAMVEFALVFPVMLMFMAMLFELSRYAVTKQNLRNLVRETGMLAMHRIDPPSATNFPNVVKSAVQTSQPVNLTNDGRFYVGQVMRMGAGNPPPAKIVQYSAFGNLNAPAKVLAGGFNGTANLPSHVVLQTNQIMYIVECFYRFRPVMEWNLAGLTSTINETNMVYDDAYF